MTITEQLKKTLKSSKNWSAENTVDALISAGLLKPSERSRAILKAKATRKVKGSVSKVKKQQ
jgi:hypothetical protein